jgi:hypothetical protein
LPRNKNKNKTDNTDIPAPVEGDVDNLMVFSAEAEQVGLMTRHPGWSIIKRDLETYRQKMGEAIPYLSPGTEDFNKSRLLYIASDKLLGMVEDYDQNRKRALELIEKLENQKENIVLDVDNSG